jgi:hypothetical protein
MGSLGGVFLLGSFDGAEEGLIVRVGKRFKRCCKVGALTFWVKWRRAFLTEL